MKEIQKDQNKVLFFASFTEFGERYSYYVIQALLIFFLLDKFHISEAKSSSLVGTALGMIYISAIVGGYIADRLIGHYRAAYIGSILMVLGSFLLTLSKTEDILFIGLSFISISTGLIKSNMSSFLGDFYDKSKLSDSYRDFGFNIFYVGINFGSLFALFFASLLKDHYGFRMPFYSSLFITFLMFLNLTIGFKQLKKYIHYEINVSYAWPKTFAIIIAYAILVFITLKTPNIATAAIFIASAVCLFILIKSAQGKNWRNATIVGIFFLLSILYWMLYFQQYISLLVYIDKTVSHSFLGFNLGSSQFLSSQSLSIVILGGIIGKVWLYFGNKGKAVNDIDKFNLGFIFIALMFVLLLVGNYIGAPTDKVPAFIIILSLFIISISELCLSAIGLSMITKNAPDGYVSLYMGIWLVTLGIGGKLSGFLSSFINITNNVAEAKANMSHGLILFIALSILGIILCLIARKFIIRHSNT